MTFDEEVTQINRMSYEEMFRLWRFAPVGHKYFQTGTPLTEAFMARWNELRSNLKPGEHAATSKMIGWE